MPTATYIALANLTLSSAQAEVTFSSIPATYRDLVVVANGESPTNGSLLVRFNGDTGSNYPTVYMYQDSSGTYNIGYFYSGGTQGQFACVLNVMDYAQTDKHKTTLARLAKNGSEVEASGIRWANTDAITSVTIRTSSNNFSTGCTFALYGIVS
jgi:hypothetical protein